MLNTLKTKLSSRKLNRRGMTLLEVLGVLVILLIIIVALSNIGDMRKGMKSSDTLKWTKDLSAINAQISADNDRNKYLFEVTVDNIRPYYRSKVLPPSINAYTPATGIVFEGTQAAPIRTLNFTGAGQVTYVEGSTANPKINNTVGGGGTNPLTKYTLKSTKGINLEIGTLNTMSFLGSADIYPFVNTIIPNIEEHILLGLLGAGTTDIGNDYVRAKNTSTAMTMPSGTIDVAVKALFGKVFGADAVDTLSDRGTDRIIDLKLIDSIVVQEYLGGKSNIADSAKYRLFWVYSIATRAEAQSILTGNGITPEAAGTFYDAMMNNISVNSIIAMPNSEADVVYSQKSDFKHIKFTLND